MAASKALLSTVVELDGVKRTVEEWAALRKLKHSTIANRRDNGWGWPEALAPLKQHKGFRSYGNSPYSSKKKVAV